ncbi:MAG: flagellar basal body P-ring protein FlgI [Pirellulaceae bacterium]
MNWHIRALPSFGMCAIATALLLATGCSHLIKRGQSPDVEAMEFNEQLDELVYIGDIGGPVGLDKLKVDGIALVTQLDGTGSEPADTPQRKYLVEEIETHQIDDIPGLLASDDNSMASIMGFIPPGARKGDKFDVLVQAMPRSKTTSMNGGFVMQTRMKPFVATRRSVQFGHNSALARGRLVTTDVFETGDKDALRLGGVILGGGTVTRDRTTGLRLLDEHASIKYTTTIARAINMRFSTRVAGSPEGVANPVSDRMLEILIPEDYDHNVGRYFHVMLNIVFNETADQRVNRLEQLERELHMPDKTSLAAIRLEAIGDDAKGVLTRGLRSEHFKVQFHAAQALSYMGDNSGVEFLQRAADKEPAFRWHALTALTSLRDSICEKALVSLFNADSAEARYGAFNALRDSQPGSPMADGEFVSREFMLHTVPSMARPMIHVSRKSVPEIVIFNGDQHFGSELLYVESGLTIKSIGNGKVQLQRYMRGNGDRKVVCSSLVSDVIRNAVRMGLDYSDTIRLLKDARQTGALDSQLVINALPKLSNSYRAEEAIEAAAEAQAESPSSRNVSTARKPDQGKGIFGNINR